jgi:hypothetical protein
MKQYIYSFIILVLAAFNTQAQDTTPTHPTTPAKGYYSIKGHADRLPPARLSVTKGAYPTVTKGYYAIGNHQTKLPRQTRIYVAPKRLEATKGYYSIKGE